jgi:hypothetical protein
MASPRRWEPQEAPLPNAGATWLRHYKKDGREGFPGFLIPFAFHQLRGLFAMLRGEAEY